MDNFDSIRAKVVNRFKLDALSPKEQDEVFSWFRTKLMDRIDQALLEMLEQQDRKEYREIFESKGYESALRFLESKIPNLPYAVDLLAIRILKDFGITFDEQF